MNSQDPSSKTLAWIPRNQTIRSANVHATIISFVRSSAINLQHQQKSANHSFPDASCYEADTRMENKMQA